MKCVLILSNLVGSATTRVKLVLVCCCSGDEKARYRIVLFVLIGSSLHRLGLHPCPLLESETFASEVFVCRCHYSPSLFFLEAALSVLRLGRRLWSRPRCIAWVASPASMPSAHGRPTSEHADAGMTGAVNLQNLLQPLPRCVPVGRSPSVSGARLTWI